MRSILIATTLVAMLEPAFARDYTQEIARTMRACKLEVEAHALTDRGATPSCGLVRDLVELQRLHVEAEVALRTGQPMPEHDAGERQPAVRPLGGSYVNSPRLAPRRVYDESAGRWCWVFQNGATMKCE